MVLVKILMEIDPLLMRGLLVMMLVMISPSRREVSPAEQLCQSPRLVPPRFLLKMVAPRPESPHLSPHYPPGRTRGAGVPWCLVGTCLPPSGSSSLQ